MRSRRRYSHRATFVDVVRHAVRSHGDQRPAGVLPSLIRYIAGQNPGFSAANTGACKCPLVASTEVDCSVIGAPSRSVKRPPASLTIATHAAISRIFTSL